jgi:hypothetical protein
MTAQAHENLVYEGERTSMAACPPLPASHPRIVALSPQELRTRKDLPSVVGSTACWRGYIGSWEIREGRLYLTGVVGRYEMLGDEPVFAEWFSGVLRVPRGGLLQYVHMGYESVYERDLYLKIEGGAVVETWTVDNRKSGGGDEGAAAPPSWWRKLFGRDKT